MRPARWRRMLSFDYDVGPLGTLILIVMAIPAAIVGYMLFTATRQVRRQVIDEEKDEDAQ